LSSILNVASCWFIGKKLEDGGSIIAARQLLHGEKSAACIYYDAGNYGAVCAAYFNTVSFWSITQTLVNSDELFVPVVNLVLRIFVFFNISKS
jgi:hypothetical protein